MEVVRVVNLVEVVVVAVGGEEVMEGGEGRAAKRKLQTNDSHEFVYILSGPVDISGVHREVACSAPSGQSDE